MDSGKLSDRAGISVDFRANGSLAAGVNLAVPTFVNGARAGGREVVTPTLVKGASAGGRDVTPGGGEAIEVAEVARSEALIASAVLSCIAVV